MKITRIVRRLFYILSFMTILYVPLTHTTPFATQLITTLIDEGEPSVNRGEIDKNGTLLKLGTISENLYMHLLEEQSILIVNSSLLHFLMAWLKKNDNPLDLNPKPTINASKWIKRKIDDNLYILAPIDYIKNLPNYKEIQKLDLKKLGSRYSAEELATGLQLNGATISDKDFFEPSSYKTKDKYDKKEVKRIINMKNTTLTITYSSSWISDHFIHSLNNIFIPLPTYTNLSIAQYAPTSVIMTNGHGSTYESIEREIKNLKNRYGNDAQNEIDRLRALQKKGFTALLGGQIAGLSSHDFGEFVGYIVKNLQTSLLFFNTCYGSEINIHAALTALAEKEKKELKDLTIPYIIISGAVSNAPAYSQSSISIKTKTTYNTNNQPTITQTSVLSKPIFKNFMTTLNNNNYVSDDLFIQALNSIYPLYGDVSSYNNIPIIKYPNDAWRPLHMPDKILLISPAFIQKYNGQKAVNVSNIFAKQSKPYPRVILFDVPEVPFDLTISGNNPVDLPAFISYLPGNAIHHLTKLDVGGYNLTDVANNFFAISQLKEDKIFLIDELVVINNLNSFSNTFNQQVVLSDVVIMHKAPDDIDPNPRYIVNFAYDNKYWQSDIAFDEMDKAISEDTAGIIKQEWNDLKKLSQSYTSQVQQTKSNMPHQNTNQPNNQNINSGNTNQNVTQKADAALQAFGNACMDIAR